MIERLDRKDDGAWYERALGFKREAYTSPAEPGERIALKFGQHKFNLRLTRSSGWATCKVHAPGSLDLCIITAASSRSVA